ncbi:hypothetical protein F66182_790 [Fusarium sp. NRRL 66182]|nr:hypothetical protein F66182_790 [Fusarium sp. NRRL 66182]
MLAKVFSAFLFLTAVTADLHANCACDNGQSYNWRITVKACEDYNASAYEWGGATYDAPSGRCVQADPEARIAGKEWEAACRKIAEGGFDCADGVGTCYAERKDVRGRC